MKKIVNHIKNHWTALLFVIAVLFCVAMALTGCSDDTVVGPTNNTPTTKDSLLFEIDSLSIYYVDTNSISFIDTGYFPNCPYPDSIKLKTTFIGETNINSSVNNYAWVNFDYLGGGIDTGFSGNQINGSHTFTTNFYVRTPSVSYHLVTFLVGYIKLTNIKIYKTY